MAIGFAKDFVIAGALIAVGITLILILYVWATFAYSLSERRLVLRWHVLGSVPFSSRMIELADIQEARTFRSKADLLGGFIFGNIPRKRIVTLVLRRRLPQFFLMKRVFITPDDSESFLTALSEHARHFRMEGSRRGSE